MDDDDDFFSILAEYLMMDTDDDESVGNKLLIELTRRLVSTPKTIKEAMNIITRTVIC